MAATESQKQLLNLIRDFAAEKSNGERRVFSLKKRIEELESELDAANVALQDAKRIKDTTDQEIKGFEVELSMNESSNLTLETRIASIQDEISKVGSDVDVLKNDEAALRDECINQMIMFKTEIRKFQEFCRTHQQSNCQRTPSGDTDAELIDLKKEVSSLTAQTATEEVEREREYNLQNQLQQDVIELNRRLELIEAIMKDIKELQNLTNLGASATVCPIRSALEFFAGYSLSTLLTSNMEEKSALFSNELQRRCICPTCHLDNSGALAELLQAMELS